MQALLVVTRFQEPLPNWGDRTRELLGELSVPLGAAFARATLNRQLFATLEAIKQLKSTSSPDALYRHADIADLEAAQHALGRLRSLVSDILDVARELPRQERLRVPERRRQGPGQRVGVGRGDGE